MAVQKLAPSFALAWFLLAGLFLMGEATGPRCKQRQVRERQPTYETFYWREACVPLAVIVGGCCGLVWWVLLIIYDVSQKGGQKGLSQISGEERVKEQNTTALDYPDEWSEEGINWDCQAANKGMRKVPWRVEFEPCPPCQMEFEPCPPCQMECEPCPPCQLEERCSTTFWAYLEQELEKILLAIRCHQTTGQNPVVEEQRSTLIVERPSPSLMVGDWQNFLAYIKQYPLTTGGQRSQVVDKQHPSPGEEQSSLAKERTKSPIRKARSRSKERTKSPNRKPRSRSKKQCRASPSSRNQGCCSRCMRPCSMHR